MKKENYNELGKIIHEFKNDCEPQFLNVTDAFWNRGSENEEVVYEIHVVIKEGKNAPSNTCTYCSPVADFGRERGLYLWDTVTDWMNGTITLRFRFEE